MTFILDWYKVVDEVREKHVISCAVRCCKDCATIYEIRQAEKTFEEIKQEHDARIIRDTLARA